MMFCLQNREFHNTIDELNLWIEKTENCIRQTEPIDLTDDISIIEKKFDKFKVSLLLPCPFLFQMNS